MCFNAQNTQKQAELRRFVQLYFLKAAAGFTFCYKTISIAGYKLSKSIYYKKRNFRSFFVVVLHYKLGKLEMTKYLKTTQ